MDAKLQAILQVHDDLALEIEEMENSLEIQQYKQKLKELGAYQDKIKKAIKEGADIEGTEKFVFEQQFVKAYNPGKLIKLIGADLASKYITETMVTEFDKELFDSDMKLGNLPEEAYGCVEKGQCRIYIKPRKNLSYSV